MEFTVFKNPRIFSSAPATLGTLQFRALGFLNTVDISLGRSIQPAWLREASPHVHTVTSLENGLLYEWAWGSVWGLSRRFDRSARRSTNARTNEGD